MTNGYLTSLSGRATFIKKLLPWLMVIISSLIGLLLVEIFCHLFPPSIVTADAEPHLIYFFDGPGTIFRNPENIFTYLPSSEIRVLTSSYSTNDFSIEYDNHIHTNNFGLVQ